MLNISKNKISQNIQLNEFKSYDQLRQNHFSKVVIWLTILFFFIILCSLFLPWTQNINAKGYVSTRTPQQRPQAIQSTIDGRLDKWYIKEGDFINAGDTIAYISEIKNDYFDPNIVERTTEQFDAKSTSIAAYDQKITALKNQYAALTKARALKKTQLKNKMSQTRNKISNDSIKLVALEQNFILTQNQLERTEQLQEKGLKSLSELQEKTYKAQVQEAKIDVQRNKLANQRNELANLQLELLSVDQQYADKLSKSLSDRQSAISAKMESVSATSKLQNTLSNYTYRQQFYYITAPQSGYVTKTIKKGIGQIVKAGSDIAMIFPAEYDLATEMYINPQDIPLVRKGSKVFLKFDGWPTVVISGWPEASTGVFQGRVAAIDRYISDNGMYRIIVSPDTERKQWPELLSIGTGARGFLLLNRVPLWYEIWRQLNGFPPDFYIKEDQKKEKLKRKAPIKSIK